MDDQTVFSTVVRHLRRNARDIVGKRILNVKAPQVIPVAKQLERGDELCRERTIPMSSQLIKKVSQIYNNCDAQRNSRSATPLMQALELGLVDMVWGFIECAKQTDSNLLTHETGDKAVREFLWLPNTFNDKTAFDVAFDKNQVEVASLLLKYAPLKSLKSQLKKRGKTLIPLLKNNPKYDGNIFGMLKNEKRGELSQPRSHQNHDDSPKESIIEMESITELLNQHLQPQPERKEEVQEAVLRNLDHSPFKLNTNKNSVLHFVSKFGHVESVEEILKKDPSMVSCSNSKEETPAYVAAREGHANVLQIMFEYMKRESMEIESIVTRGMDRNNALHIAIQNHHVEVVFFLIEQLPQLANCVNDYNESPIYLAAERKYSSVLELMFKKCREIDVAGPNGKTALHAAAISDSPECIEYLLNEFDILNDKDDNGWTPFRYAVHHNSSLATAKLLHADRSLGYELMRENDINTSAIHIAASRGHYETMVVLLSKCPECSEFIDEKGRNILHVAVEEKKNNVIEFIFQDESLTSLINEKDNEGNTPIHLLVASDFEMMEKLMDFRVKLNVLNNKQHTPLDEVSSYDQRERLIKRIATGTRMHIKTKTRTTVIHKHGLVEREYGDEEKEAEDKRKEAARKDAEARFKIAENLVVVVTLIATASFAAGITLPGGLHSEDGLEQAGTPVQLKKAAFKAFMVTNALAFSWSCAVLLVYVALLMFRNQYVEASIADQEYVNDRIVDMYILTALALIAMAIAFATGVYAVLTPTPAWAISICVMSIITIGFGAGIMDMKLK